MSAWQSLHWEIQKAYIAPTAAPQCNEHSPSVAEPAVWLTLLLPSDALLVATASPLCLQDVA